MLEFITTILLFPIVFYCLLLLLVIHLVVYTERDYTVSPLISMLVIAFLVTLKFDAFNEVLQYIKDNPVGVSLSIVSYFIIGTIWSIFKWFLFIKEEAKFLDEKIKKHSKEYVAKDESTSKISSNDLLLANFSQLAPKVTEYKEKITTWIILWVPSFIWFMINDPIRRVSNWIYNRLINLYQVISDKAFKVN